MTPAPAQPVPTPHLGQRPFLRCLLLLLLCRFLLLFLLRPEVSKHSLLAAAPSQRLRQGLDRAVFVSTVHLAAGACSSRLPRRAALLLLARRVGVEAGPGAKCAVRQAWGAHAWQAAPLQLTQPRA